MAIVFAMLRSKNKVFNGKKVGPRAGESLITSPFLCYCWHFLNGDGFLIGVAKAIYGVAMVWPIRPTCAKAAALPRRPRPQKHRKATRGARNVYDAGSRTYRDRNEPLQLLSWLLGNVARIQPCSLRLYKVGSVCPPAMSRKII